MSLQKALCLSAAGQHQRARVVSVQLGRAEKGDGDELWRLAAVQRNGERTFVGRPVVLLVVSHLHTRTHAEGSGSRNHSSAGVFSRLPVTHLKQVILNLLMKILSDVV